MPRFTQDDTMETQQTFTGHFGFSATRIEHLGAAEYTLVSIAVDRSGSTESFRGEMIKTMKEIVKSCAHSPRSNNLLLRVTTFSDDLEEFHGFKPLSACKLEDYNTLFIGAGSMTALYDATRDAGESLLTYGEKLYRADFSINGILFVITDGLENASKYRFIDDVKQAIRLPVTKETLESLTTILIGVNITSPEVSAALNKFQTGANFTQYVEIGNATKSALAKLAQFVSRSISSQSQSLGTGGPSTPLTF